MSSNYLLTRYRQSSVSLTSRSDSSDRLSSPSLEPEAWVSRQSPPGRVSPSISTKRQFSTPASTQPTRPVNPQSSDLFATLLLNRERAYRDSSTPAVQRLPERFNRERTYTPTSHTCVSSEHRLKQSPASSPGHERKRLNRTSTSAASRGEDPEEDMMRLRLKVQPEKEAPKVSKRRGRPPKDTTKSTGKTEEPKTRKRKAADDTSRQRSASKTPRKRVSRTEPKANIGKKVGGNSSNLMLAKSPAPEVIVIDSDDEDNTQTKNPEDQTQTTNMLHQLKSYLSTRKAPEVHVPIKVDEEATALDRAMANPPSSSLDFAPGCSVADHGNLLKELQKLREDLQTERDLVQSLRQEMEKREANALLEKQKYELRALQELETERQRSRVQHQSSQDIQVKYAKLETDHTALKAELEQVKSARKQEQEHHSEVLNDILKAKNEEEHTREQVESLQNDKARLLAENETLKAVASASRKIPTLSPVPSSSSSSTEEERRDENVRKMYIKVKRQYDILHSVANDLAICTRSMDLSSFGEFGTYMKKLRNSLDMDGRTSAGQPQGSWKSEEDPDCGMKSSTA